MASVDIKSLHELRRCGRLPDGRGLSLLDLLERVGADEVFMPPPTPRLPNGASTYLQASNQRLIELKGLYSTSCHPTVDTGQWTSSFVETQVPLTAFRGDCAYVWQWRDLNVPVAYLLTAYYLRTIGAGEVLNRLSEDDYFGAYTVSTGDGYVLSRDLLDSASELWFLERWTGILSGKIDCVLDIGCGYGRLAHRIAQSCSAVRRILCADSIAESTFLCEYYLRFRGVNQQALAIPVTDIDAVVAQAHPQLAVSIHCMDESCLRATTWWIRLLKQHSVRYFMLVVNDSACKGTLLLGIEPNGGRADFGLEILRCGYRLIAREPKYSDRAVQRFGVSPAHYMLFELR